MAFSIDRDVTLFDIAELGKARTRLHWWVLKEMLVNGQNFAGREDGRLVALWGVYPMGDDVGEAWFNVDLVAAKNMLPLIRHARLTRSWLPYREIVTICVSEQGKRIAKAMGFSFCEPSEFGEVWKLWTS